MVRPMREPRRPVARIDNHESTLREQTAGRDRRHASGDWTLAGISTAVLDGGDGAPIVLPARARGVCCQMDADASRTWCMTHRVVAPDLPAHGASQALDGAAGRRSGARLARRADRTHMPVGAGAGRDMYSAVRIAARFAVDRGDRLQSARPRGRAGPGPLPAGAEVRAHPARLPGAPDRAHVPPLHAPVLVRSRRPARADGRAAGSRFVAYNLELARGQSAKAGGPHVRELGMPRIPPAELARIAVPTTLIWGRQRRRGRA